MTDYRWNLHENCHAMEHRLTGIFDQGVLDPEQAQRHLRERLRNEAKQMLETTLLHEADEQLAAVRYQRSASRLDQRNGYRKRNLTGLFGEVTLRVPRARHIGLEFSVFAAYERRWREVDALLLEAFVAGASSRKTGAQLARLLGTRLSATTIANLTRALDEQLGAFHTSPIQDQYAGLIVDGMYMTIRGLGPTITSLDRRRGHYRGGPYRPAGPSGMLQRKLGGSGRTVTQPQKPRPDRVPPSVGQS